MQFRKKFQFIAMDGRTYCHGWTNLLSWMDELNDHLAIARAEIPEKKMDRQQELISSF